MTIEVTADDIRKGKAMNCDRSVCCPIALAARRAYPNVCVSVGSHNLNWHIGRRSSSYVMHSIELPVAAINFISAFDDLGKSEVKPFAFEVA